MAIHVAVLSTDQRLEETLRAAGVTTTRLDRESRGAKPQPAGHPAALIVDIRGQSQLPAALPAFRKEYPSASVILVASTLDPRLMLDAMRAGVNECVQEPLTPDALGQAIRKVVSGSQPQPTGQVFAFVGAKGGVGTTTLSVNTATMLARAGKADVLLIDLHVGHGDAALLLGVEPRFSVVDALENVHRVDESFFGSVVEKTKAGIDLLASSDRILAGGIDPQRLRALIEFAATAVSLHSAGRSALGRDDARRAGSGVDRRGRDQPGAAVAAERGTAGAYAAHPLWRRACQGGR